ncbi:MAG: serine/threonine-protein kinase [Candidatus Margulisiibacteriota bacterium]
MERFLKSRYRTGDKISDNPFCATYQGFFVGTNKPVVIKIYKRGTLNSTLINRMKQKVRDFSLISNDNIVKMIDGDYGWQGFYYVREFVDGQSLKQLLDSGKEVGVEQAADIAEEVCGALEAAHARGIIHGGIKPSNVFIDKQGIVKVADFIIEGEIKEAMPQKALMVIDDGKYFSPEELAGEPATYSSDIYAVGMLLWEMLAPKTCFKGKGMAGGLSKIRSRVVLDKNALAQFPRYLQDIIFKALQRDPAVRFASIADLRESLEKKTVIEKKPAGEDFAEEFDKTVTNYDEEELATEEKEALQEVGQTGIRWGKESHRIWFLLVLIAASFLAGLLYVFWFGQ